MRSISILAIACLAMIVTSFSAMAFLTPETNAAWPTQHQREARYAESLPAPYAMNYSDEAAQSLGVRNGRWEAFATQSTNPLMPSLHGGIDKGGAAISLQWRPGQ
jgi:hypothetical protein